MQEVAGDLARLDDKQPTTTKRGHPMDSAEQRFSRRCWLTFPTRGQVEQPIIWRMSRQFPDVSFDIRQASVQHEIGIMAVLFQGPKADVLAALQFLRDAGVQVDPIEKSVVEG
jgi:L-aspartate semialdehyde sulfurtransferase ferredoxin